VLIDDALIQRNGTISYMSTCILCKKEFGWYAPVQKEFKSIDNTVKAEAVISNGLIDSGKDLWAEFDIYAVCPACGIKNQYHGIKYKIR